MADMERKRRSSIGRTPFSFGKSYIAAPGVQNRQLAFGTDTFGWGRPRQACDYCFH